MAETCPPKLLYFGHPNGFHIFASGVSCQEAFGACPAGWNAFNPLAAIVGGLVAGLITLICIGAFCYCIRQRRLQAHRILWQNPPEQQYSVYPLQGQAAYPPPAGPPPPAQQVYGAAYDAAPTYYQAPPLPYNPFPDTYNDGGAQPPPPAYVEAIGHPKGI
ncbi:uncharacterized protein SPPG_04255 [Spizellomyces punctatus DAOM BR117]|uniref:Uncharacterized protein n=1 Tax=Spizellomyces punctatus (strain DAOM BR117) TaxID=645134 RepID=A0A0L0HJV7_SPIPD|nr:uncharacterized protein SPPG_04255 [Spizellomyces punctatus DAOM BR117]KND01165.1 hypothetical protein SPPG_04255 [Spizellomyces punctatus DAOM BR117]|eukprot:XP_016609204.1 hypothetical protein SPPG_04255 [Spizellomyces punctatus DAOM BR117]